MTPRISIAMSAENEEGAVCLVVAQLHRMLPDAERTWWHQGRLTNMSALLYTGSVMVFLMGLISQQISALMYRGHE
ncbi:MAG: hypothetical protein QM569_02370 [Acidovorax sp.]|uniref:hypothetical protein n=1 Tax=Acidovorax sp. TaxID=1872122 RepID=UPI0039E31953